MKKCYTIEEKARPVLVALMFLFLYQCFIFSAGAQTMMAGTGKANITADCGHVHDSLYVKALVLDNRETRVAIITIDVVAVGTIGDIPADFFPATRNRLQKELAIDHVLVCASHNHLDGFINGGGKLVTDVGNRTIQAVKSALSNLEKVKVGAGKGFESRIAMNRRIQLKDGTVFTIRHANPNMPDEQMDGVGPTDPEIGILRIDRMNGTPKALLFNYACHPYTGVPDKGVTADYPGFACKILEEELGHQTMAFFLQGAAGNITEILYKDVNNPRDSEVFGRQLALSTLKGYREIVPEKTNKLLFVDQAIDFPLRRDIPDWLSKLDSEEKKLLDTLKYTSLNIKTFIPLYIKNKLSPEYPSYYAYRYMQEEKDGLVGLRKMDLANRQDMEKYLSNIHAMEKLSQIQVNREMLEHKQQEIAAYGGSTVAAEIAAVRIGDFVLVTLPAEAFVEVGLNIKEVSPFPNTFFAGYTNGYIHYAPVVDSYSEGGYEVMNCILAPDWEVIYKNRISEILKDL